ncbi:MAG: glycosyltransferase [Pseudomonadota bacterium]|nr:glycosyltransferase [Pseudomonadota bacterium]
MSSYPAEKIFIVTIRYKRGQHTDVYVDFEEDILKHTGWKFIKASNNIIERIFEKFFLPYLGFRTFFFNLPALNRNRILFSTLSGIEYTKIIQHYIFQTKLKVIYQFDTWTHDNAINENAFRSFRINVAFISIRKAADYFNSLGIPEFEAHWVPEAVSIGKYLHVDFTKRDIDLLQFGRRWDWLHDNLAPYCRSNAINYQYPEDDDISKRQFLTRNDLICALSRTKIAVCVPKTITHPKIYDLDTITSRYFECMASKCLILGHAPDDLVSLFGYNPVIEIDKFNTTNQLKYLLDHYYEFIPLIEKNYQHVKDNHQWSNRIADMQKIISRRLMSFGNNLQSTV